MRRVGYRNAATAFVFTGLWLVIGLFVLWTPIPSALGIRGEMFVAWLLLFFAILGVSGAILFLAAFNAIFPPNVRAPRRAEARTPGNAPPGRRPPAGAARSSSTHRG